MLNMQGKRKKYITQSSQRHRDLKEIRYFFSVFPVVFVREKIILKIVLNHWILRKYVLFNLKVPKAHTLTLVHFSSP